jgi:hypothetical protein
MYDTLTVSIRQRPMPLRRIGGLYHWRIGRLGGSFYIARGSR